MELAFLNDKFNGVLCHMFKQYKKNRIFYNPSKYILLNIFYVIKYSFTNILYS